MASKTEKKFDYSEKVDELLTGVGAFEATDFLVLMMAAADQAGLSLKAQKAVLQIV